MKPNNNSGSSEYELIAGCKTIIEQVDNGVIPEYIFIQICDVMNMKKNDVVGKNVHHHICG